MSEIYIFKVLKCDRPGNEKFILFPLVAFLNRETVACETDSLCFYISVISNILQATIFLLFSA